ELTEGLEQVLRRLTPEDTLRAETDGDLTVESLLLVALRNELEATEIAARWMATTPEVEVKLAFARQIGDEAKHYRLIQERLRALGVNLAGFNPLAKGYGELYLYLTTLSDMVERIAAAQFTREAIATVWNAQFIAFCERQGDGETARLYREVVQVDEAFHHELGKKLLARYATTPEQQAKARAAVSRTLELAEEMQNLYVRQGMRHAPGC
ncbi:MAG: ferritin-like domain-containing protein, partial [candidate division NC10 bacterium]|nr:ferritin-like domain-containing protein [candidate division NC10 bacterium]